jgi:predicted ATPase
MPARNNTGIVTIRDVTRTVVAMEHLCNHVSVERNTHNNRRDVFSVQPVPTGYKKDKAVRLGGLNLAVVKLTTVQMTKLPL